MGPAVASVPSSSLTRSLTLFLSRASYAVHPLLVVRAVSLFCQNIYAVLIRARSYTIDGHFYLRLSSPSDRDSRR
jgi:hypothetical protein